MPLLVFRMRSTIFLPVHRESGSGYWLLHFSNPLYAAFGPNIGQDTGHMPPTFSEMDMWLSLSTMMKLLFSCCGIVQGFKGHAARSERRLRSPKPLCNPLPEAPWPGHSPRPAEIEVELCPVSNASQLAFLSLGKSAHSAVLSKGIKSFLAPGKKLMGIGLMSHIPDDLIFRQVKRQMQRNGQLHHPKVGRQMAAGSD